MNSFENNGGGGNNNAKRGVKFVSSARNKSNKIRMNFYVYGRLKNENPHSTPFKLKVRKKKNWCVSCFFMLFRSVVVYTIKHRCVCRPFDPKQHRLANAYTRSR